MSVNARRSARFNRHPLSSAARLLAFAVGLAPAILQAQAPAEPAEPSDSELPPLRVKAKRDRATEGTDAYTARSAATATKLDLSLRDTPQSISVVPRAMIEDFVLNDVNDLLATVTGVNVERVEPDRAYFSVRGFEVSNFQIDGIGLPFATGDQLGHLDTTLYDRVEVLRGANGLMSSTGNPSATVNFVRKRPTPEFRAAAALTLGSWNERRVDADVSGALTQDRRVRGRLIAAAEESDSHLDRYSRGVRVFSGILETELAPGTTVAAGHSQQRNRPRGTLWGALPLAYSDGTPTRYPVSASSAPDWTHWHTDDTQTFAELTQRLHGGWRAQAVVTRRTLSSDAELFFVTGTPDRADGSGMASWPSKYGHTERQWIADAHVRGPLSLAGRRHELVLGANWARSDNHLHSSDDDGSVPLTEAEMLAGTFPRPAFDRGVSGFADFTDRRTTLYGVARIDATDALKLIVGASVTRATSGGVQYGTVHDYRATRLAPYLGATWTLDDHLALYASHGAIYNPQYHTDASNKVLSPIEGRNAEMGLKGEWMQGRLNGSLAVFEVRQDNTAESAGFDETLGRTVYRGIDARSRGFELDLAGTLAPGWEAGGGFTQLSIQGPDGNPVRTYVPRKTLRFTTSWRVPALAPLKLGASVRWQSEFHRSDDGAVARQPAHALLDLVASWQFTPKLGLTAKVENATDRKVLTSLMWPDQSFYAPPRHGSVTLRWTY